MNNNNIMDIPSPPNFRNRDLDAKKPQLDIKNDGTISSADILAAKNFESRLIEAVTNSNQTTFAEVQAWKLYIIDLEQSRCKYIVTFRKLKANINSIFFCAECLQR